MGAIDDAILRTGADGKGIWLRAEYAGTIEWTFVTRVAPLIPVPSVEVPHTRPECLGCWCPWQVAHCGEKE